MKRICWLFLFSFLFFSACSENNDTPTGTATYRITFEGDWTAASHPRDYPPDPHFSPLIGMVHAESIALFTEGTTASPGIKRMAELGTLAPLDAEITERTDGGRLGRLITGDWLATGTASTEVTVEVSGQTPYVSLVSMIAPSPDWFVAVRRIYLWEEGWVDRLEVPAVLYDAGTDSGATFTSPDSPTDPPGPVGRLVAPPLGDGSKVEPPVAHFVFSRVE